MNKSQDGEQRTLLKDQDDQGAEPPLLATTNQHMLADLFDNLMALEDATDNKDT